MFMESQGKIYHFLSDKVKQMRLNQMSNLFSSGTKNQKALKLLLNQIKKALLFI